MPSPRPQFDPTATSIGRAVALTLLRIGGPLILGIIHGRELAIGAYRSIWLEEPWPLAAFLNERGLRYGVVLAGIFVFLLALCLPAMVLGILTRVAATILLVFAIIGALLNIGYQTCEIPLLYAAVFLAVLLAGPGGFSLDALITRKRR